MNEINDALVCLLLFKDYRDNPDEKQEIYTMGLEWNDR